MLRNRPGTILQFPKVFNGAEATCVKIANEIKKCFRLKDMLNFNVI